MPHVIVCTIHTINDHLINYDVFNLSIVLPEHTQKVATVLRKYKEALDQEKLLQLSFTTLSEYLWLLRSACQALAPLGNRAILYLAAAVSDFYIPSNEMVNKSFNIDYTMQCSLLYQSNRF